VHDTAVSAWPGSAVSAGDHDLPFQMNAAPTLSTATQKSGPLHDNPETEGPPIAPAVDASCLGPLQRTPFQSRASPVESTAAQNDRDEHDTPTSCDEVPYTVGSVHELPFHMDTPPWTDMQNEGLTHEMEVTLPQSWEPSDHPEPSK
jgi:hypothetical protein